MPIYEYRCSDCDARFEKIVWRSNQKIECPSCGSSQIQTLLSTFAVGAGSSESSIQETGPCPCGALRRGRCGE